MAATLPNLVARQGGLENGLTGSASVDDVLPGMLSRNAIWVRDADAPRPTEVEVSVEVARGHGGRPTPAQERAWEVLVGRPHVARRRLLQAALHEYRQLDEVEPGWPDPAAATSDDLVPLVGVGEIHLQVREKEGTAYLTIHADLRWRRGGLGVLLHRERLVGTLDPENRDDHLAQQDGGR